MGKRYFSSLFQELEGLFGQVWRGSTIQCLVTLVLLCALNQRTVVKYKRENVFENNGTYC